ncbi:MAG: ATP-binding protein [Myxococcota bacterium]|jgi:ATP-dependent DNA helicase RecG|nr:ATP-binding protein [Myxococcota bacterium]
MNSILPIGIEQLLGGAVEKARLELKASWDPQTTGVQVLKTLCAFANDLHNLNGGYIVIGVAEQDGAVARPVKGLDSKELEEAQKWIRGNCERIVPTYQPVMDVVEVDDTLGVQAKCPMDKRLVLVLWAPASDVRPHQAPNGPKGAREYWVRVGCETVVARDAILTALMQQTARVPFDDRRAQSASNEELNFSLVREFLHDVQSALRDETDANRVYAAMQLVARVNDHTVPRNAALLMFSVEPERWFRGARIEVVEFLDDAGGDMLAETVFRGPLHHQLRQSLSYLESMTTRYLDKGGASLEAKGWLSFPVPALREAIVNAVYHRSYEASVEPTKVYLYPNRIEVISYPGPVPGIEQQHLDGDAPMPPVPARNRRIGEYLKELRLAEARGTGLPKIRRSMEQNGSPAPRFDFDQTRSYFRVTLPAHPEFIARRVLGDYAYRKATGEHQAAKQVLQRAWRDGMRSGSIAEALVREHSAAGELQQAEQLVDGLTANEAMVYASSITALAAAYAEAGDSTKSKALLDRLPSVLAARDAFDAAIVERRLGRQERAHQLFERAGDLVLQDVRALHEFAQTKLSLTKGLAHSGRPADQQTRRKLLQEALSFLERVTQMDAPPARQAWAWFNLGQARGWLQFPKQNVLEAYRRACELLPSEERFRRALMTSEREA